MKHFNNCSNYTTEVCQVFELKPNSGLFLAETE